jgi:glycosyltransferase involved in cell wall biosynthesis
MTTGSALRDEFVQTPTAEKVYGGGLFPHDNHNDRLDLTFFVSCYDERDYIIETIETVRTAMAPFAWTYELVIIDDASSDGSAALIRRYIADHPDEHIVFRRNAANKGWAQNYIDGAFIGKGRYYKAICGDNSSPPEAIRPIVEAIGQADIIIPYYVYFAGKDLFRRTVSRVYTALVNLVSGNRLHYYNGLAIHYRHNVMRWHTNTRGFGFQADILCLLLAQGVTYVEVPTTTVERREGASNALKWRNLLSVTHTLIDIFFRRISNLIHGPIAAQSGGRVEDGRARAPAAEDPAVRSG